MNSAAVSSPFLPHIQKIIQERIDLRSSLKHLRTMKKAGFPNAEETTQCWDDLKVKSLTQLCVSVYAVVIVHTIGAVVASVFGRLARSVPKKETKTGTGDSSSELSRADKIACMELVVEHFAEKGLPELTDLVDRAVRDKTSAWSGDAESLKRSVGVTELQDTLTTVRRRVESGEPSSRHPFARFVVVSDLANRTDISTNVLTALRVAFDAVCSPLCTAAFRDGNECGFLAFFEWVKRGSVFDGQDAVLYGRLVSFLSVALHKNAAGTFDTNAGDALIRRLIRVPTAEALVRALYRSSVLMGSS